MWFILPEATSNSFLNSNYFWLVIVPLTAGISLVFMTIFAQKFRYWAYSYLIVTILAVVLGFSMGQSLGTLAIIVYYIAMVIPTFIIQIMVLPISVLLQEAMEKSAQRAALRSLRIWYTGTTTPPAAPPPEEAPTGPPPGPNQGPE